MKRNICDCGLHGAAVRFFFLISFILGLDASGSAEILLDFAIRLLQVKDINILRQFIGLISRFNHSFIHNEVSLRDASGRL